MPDPTGVLLCPPDHFDVVDVKNPFMEGHAGTIDKSAARAQWDALSDAFRDAGMTVETLDPTPGCEDMVFAANQTFPGRHSSGRLVCLLSHMRYESRRREVAAYATWFSDHGYTVIDAVPEGELFEGGGDALWHPGRHFIWAGYGGRTGQAAHKALAEVFDAPVASLRLVDERFYHLDTCLCAIDEKTALWFPGAFDEQGRAMLAEGFANLIEVDEQDAIEGFACNAAAFPGGVVVIDRRAEATIEKLAGYRVIAVDTGEYLKSGGSVFCLKQYLY
ncbi:MAG: dimethylarginine dimethylaminohydrolase family protein [Planctomycetota bacterium]|jgi:N-dimethylarginine dimethylaminohydrolase